jgi:hypothetical protein
MSILNKGNMASYIDCCVFLEPFYKIMQELQGDKCLTSAVPFYNEVFDHLDD